MHELPIRQWLLSVSAIFQAAYGQPSTVRALGMEPGNTRAHPKRAQGFTSATNSYQVPLFAVFSREPSNTILADHDRIIYLQSRLVNGLSITTS